MRPVVFLIALFYIPISVTATSFSVPCVVHQIYDYQTPNYFLYLSLMAVHRYIRPERHILWVNDEGRYRKSHWDSWQQKAQPLSWEANLTAMFRSKQIEVQLLPFPLNPPGNASILVSNKAHRSDFVRMDVLLRMGGMYLDTDAFPVDSLTELRRFNFSLGFDNIVADANAPKVPNSARTFLFPCHSLTHSLTYLLTPPRSSQKLNNGVILSAPNAPFLRVWSSSYADFDPTSWDYHSSVLPWKLAAANPDLIHVEMSRLSPISYGFQTATAAAALTCGILVQTQLPHSDIGGDGSNGNSSRCGGPGWRELAGHTFYAIWYPRWCKEKHAWTFEGTAPDPDLFNALSQKMVLHLTMSAVRGE